MMFGKGCKFNHQSLRFAGVNDKDTWACPYCHLIFQRPKTREGKNHIKTVKNYGKLKD